MNEKEIIELNYFIKKRLLKKYKRIFSKKEYLIIKNNIKMFEKVYLIGVVDGYDSNK